MRKKYVIIVMTMLMVFGVSCDSMRHLDPNYETLDERIDSYHKAYQWRQYQKASYYVIPHMRNDFTTTMDQFVDTLNMDSYRIGVIEENEEGDEATVTAHRSYFIVPSITLQHDTLKQTWVLIEGEWYLSGPPY